MKKAHVASVVAALLLFAVRVFAGDDVTLRTAAQIGSAPKFVESAEPGAKVSGICVDLYRAMEKAHPGLHIVGDQKWLPAVRIESEIAAGDLDIACAITRTEARGHQFDFIEPPLFSFDFQLAVRSDDNVDIRAWDDVRRLAPDNVILVNHGWGYVSRLADIAGLRVDDSGPTPEVNLRKLVSGRGRFFYFRSPGFATAISDADLCEEVRIIPAALDHTDAYMVLNPHLPAETAAQVRAALGKLAASGQLAQIPANYDSQSGANGCEPDKPRSSPRSR